MMHSFGLILALQAATTVPVLPPAPPAPPGPPPIIRLSTDRGITRIDPAAQQRHTIDVEVRAGSELLWSGPMAITGVQGANFNRQLTEPALQPCETGGYGQQMRNALSMQLDPQRSYDSGDSIGVTVQWTRSLPAACPFRSSTRKVELTETTRLAANQTVMLNGDGGLTIRLRRR